MKPTTDMKTEFKNNKPDRNTVSTLIENILKDNSTFVHGQVDGLIIHGAIEKITDLFFEIAEKPEELYYRNLKAVCSNIVEVVKCKQWERLDSKTWAVENALELLQNSENPHP